MAWIKLELSPYMGPAVSKIAQLMGRSQKDVVELLLFRVETLLRNGKGEAFGLEWQEIAATLNAQGLGAQHLDPVVLAGGESIGFDIDKLEKSGKSKSSYAGVYATSGSSFRALVPDVEKGGTRYLASRPTALRAAIDRFEWFKKYKLPYGNLAFQIEHMKKMRPGSTEREILEAVLIAGTGLGVTNAATVEEVEEAIAALDAREGKTDPIQPFRDALARDEPEYKAPPAKVTCAICKEEIVSGEPLGPYGKSEWAHFACSDSA